ncbi:MAG: hypothetical protein ACXAEX_04950 [Promethearchaeota archaeon]|jgi:uncharacterized membrane protein (DUF106 family)
MSNVAIILQILLITIGMIILGMVLNRLLGLRKENMQKFREQALNLQERMKNAQALGDIQMMTQLQNETMRFTRQIMIKQFIPLCLRCFIFIGIFSALGFIYAEYDSNLLPFNVLFFGSGWVGLYLLFSISISLLIYGAKKLYKRKTGKVSSSQSGIREIMQIISPSDQPSGFSLPFSRSTSSQSMSLRSSTNYSREENESSESSDSWKERIQK